MHKPMCNVIVCVASAFGMYYLFAHCTLQFGSPLSGVCAGASGGGCKGPKGQGLGAAPRRTKVLGPKRPNLSGILFPQGGSAPGAREGPPTRHMI